MREEYENIKKFKQKEMMQQKESLFRGKCNQKKKKKKRKIGHENYQSLLKEYSLKADDCDMYRNVTVKPKIIKETVNTYISLEKKHTYKSEDLFQSYMRALVID